VYTAYLVSDRREITPDALPSEVIRGASHQSREDGAEVRVPLGTSIEEAKRRPILLTLRRESGNKTRAADALGIRLKTLHNRLNLYRSEDSGLAPLEVP